MAVEAIGKNKNLSIRAAARLYNVPEATIRHRRTGRSARRELPANSRKLTDLEERTIVQYILELDARAFPPRLRGVEDMANEQECAVLSAKLPDQPPKHKPTDP